jgi:GntR family transcriptional regulator
MLKINKSTPLYCQLYARLKQEIEGGSRRPGEKLPSERQLAANHGISRLTARKAVQRLVHEGYVSAQRGSGSYVRTSKP